MRDDELLNNNINNDDSFSQEETETNVSDGTIFSSEKSLSTVSNNTEYLIPFKIKCQFCNAKKSIFCSCMMSIDCLTQTILNYFGIYNFDLLLTTYDKIGNSYTKNKEFCHRQIKDIYYNSVPNQVRKKEQYKEKNRQILDDILKDELIDPNKKIKALNAIFNLPYLDFIRAYLNDESKMIIKNNIKGETKVYFTKGKINQNSSSESILFFNFKTYKNCFNYKYDKNQKKEFKDKMLDIFLKNI